MSLFDRNLRKYGKELIIYDRNSKILNGKVTEIFSNPISCLGIVSTLSGVKVFDSTNTEHVATHKFVISYIDDITSERWIFFKGKKLRILNVENCCEMDEKLILMCTERGLDSKVVNDA